MPPPVQRRWDILAIFMHRKQLTMPTESGKFQKLERFAIARGPLPACFEGGALGFANADHLLGVPPGQFTSASQSAAPSDAREIFAHVLLSLCHCWVRACIISSLCCNPIAWPRVKNSQRCPGPHQTTSACAVGRDNSQRCLRCGRHDKGLRDARRQCATLRDRAV